MPVSVLLIYIFVSGIVQPLKFSYRAEKSLARYLEKKKNGAALYTKKGETKV